MSFNSLSYLLFLPVVLLLYWALPHKCRWVLLLLASYYFYMCWSAKLIFLILTTTLVSYVSGLCMEKTRSRKVRKFFFILTLCVDLGLLVYFKYAEFLLESFISLVNIFGANLSSVSLEILLPVGISFYTFQTLSYVIDVYRGKIRAERHIGYFALFVSYFPQLVAGPIERPDVLIPQLKQEHILSGEDFKAGIRLLVSGFIRKCVIADLCGIYVDTVYADLGSMNSLAIFLGSALFIFQIYNDFAGYSEIAMGSARLMGVKLTKNFNEPLRSKSNTEFFRRWHITLNKWFTDYVYIPLGGNRKGKIRRMLNTMIVFSLCGLWHGANWTYVLWGVASGAMVCIEGLLRKPALNICARLKINPEGKILSFVRWALFMCWIFLGGILFRSQSIAEIGTAFYRLFTEAGIGISYLSAAVSMMGLDAESLYLLLLVLFVMALLPGLTRERPAKPVLLGKDGEAGTVRTAGALVFGAVCVALCWLLLLSVTDASAFQYFQF